MEEDLAVKSLVGVEPLSEQRNEPSTRSTPLTTQLPVGRAHFLTARGVFWIGGKIDQLALNREHITWKLM